MSEELAVVGLGRMPYTEALELQRDLADRRISGSIRRDLLLLVEHPHVVTLGRASQDQHLVTPKHSLERAGIEVHEIERGGDVTYHGPGQLVGYLIYDLNEHRRDLHWFLRNIEEALILALDQLGVTGIRNQGLTGVWVENRKIASIGIHIKKWVSWHGFALNVTTDLSKFDLIVPCGISDVRMTSLQAELRARAPRDLWGRTLDATMLGFAEAFEQRPQAVALSDLSVATRT